MNYVIVKYDKSFPNYYKGSDIDLFCYNKKELTKQILNCGNKYINKGFEIKVKEPNDNHIFIDFYEENELYFRFDIYDSFPDYKKINIKKYYIYSVIENSISIVKKYNGLEYPVFLPSDIDDLLLRYIEYIEWYELRPDKIKHLDYILNKLSDESLKKKFLDKLHLYTRLSDMPVNDNYYDSLPKKQKNEIGYLKIRKFLGKFCLIRKLYGIFKKIVTK